MGSTFCVEGQPRTPQAVAAGAVSSTTGIGLGRPGPGWRGGGISGAEKAQDRPWTFLTLPEPRGIKAGQDGAELRP